MVLMTEEIPKEIWEKRKELLEKARRKELTFEEFNMLDMHKETTDLLDHTGKNGLSAKGLSTLNAITMYLETL